MLLLLPPSEGKTAPHRGGPLDLDGLGTPTLTEARRRMLTALVEVCGRPEPEAAAILGLTSGQHELVGRNRALLDAPTARAEHIYTGVLFDALGLSSLDPASRRRAASSVLITSALFGVVRPQDRIPAYRLSGAATLPGVGGVAGHWRRHLPQALRSVLGPRRLLVDLRSGTYQQFWRPEPDLAPRTVTVRVLAERNGQRMVISHHNKATKGELVRRVLSSGGSPRTPHDLADLVRSLGWTTELAAERSGHRLDVVLPEA